MKQIEENGGNRNENVKLIQSLDLFFVRVVVSSSSSLKKVHEDPELLTSIIARHPIVNTLSVLGIVS